MATFNVVGFDEVVNMLIKQSELAEQIAPDMLKAGAEILAAAQRQALNRVGGGDRSIGTLAGSIGIGRVKRSAADGLYIDVYPQGSQPHGIPRRGKRGMVSNAQVGFMLNYGYLVKDSSGRVVGSVPGKRWLESAVGSCSSAVHDAMRKVWEEKQNG